MATYFPFFSVPRCGQVNGDDRALKDALENLNTRKSTLRRIPTGILSKNSKKMANLTKKLCHKHKEARSHPKGSSVNDFIPYYCSTVKNTSVVTQAVRKGLFYGQNRREICFPYNSYSPCWLFLAWFEMSLDFSTSSIVKRGVALDSFGATF